MPFMISPLPMALFAPLFLLDDAALATHRAIRMAAPPRSPCRVSLSDATVGEPLLLCHYVHQPAASPFHASHAIYVRERAIEARLDIDAIPPALATRTLSLRAFDRHGMMRDAALVDGVDAASTIERLLGLTGIAYLHAHYAAMGCYAARIDRA